MKRLTQYSKYIPLFIGVIILVIIALIAPWEQIGKTLTQIPPYIFAILLGLSAIYYLSKAVRFWYILRLLDIKVPFKTVTLLYLSGQPFSLMPAGELYRTVLLKKHLGIRMSKSSPSVTIQGLVEAIILLLMSLIGAFILGRNRIAVGIVGLLLIFVIIALQRGWLSRMYSSINKLPFVSLNHAKFQKFVQNHRDLLAPKPLLTLMAFSLVPVLSGIGILLVSSRAAGFDIDTVQAMIGYSLPVIVSGLSFLPGGLGVSEGGTIGMMQLFGASATVAVTVALLVRVFTLVAGLIYGVIAQLLLHTRKETL